MVEQPVESAAGASSQNLYKYRLIENEKNIPSEKPQ